MKTLQFNMLRLAALVLAFTASATVNAAQDRAAWMNEARFGMFIHWGLYAGLARSEWVMNREGIPVAEYEKLAARFNPVKFNAADWVRTAKNAGMKYIVITSKHHDGFAMFGSKVTPYNIVDATPFKFYKLPHAPFVLPGIEGRVAKAYLLADPAKQPLEFTQTSDALTVSMPSKPLSDEDTVLCLTLK